MAWICKRCQRERKRRVEVNVTRDYFVRKKTLAGLGPTLHYRRVNLHCPECDYEATASWLVNPDDYPNVEWEEEQNG